LRLDFLEGRPDHRRWAGSELNASARDLQRGGAIFPGESYVTVEADRDAQGLRGTGGESQIDIWKLRLDSAGKDFLRLTHLNDYTGWVASNPVISRDGKFMVFQAGRSDAEAGAGFGLLMYRFASRPNPR
jgi:hypothetical protein